MKKHRRFLALALSLVLTLSLTTPAWAAGEDLPTLIAETGEEGESGYLDMTAFTAQYLKEHPELLDGFDADAYFEENYYYYNYKKANFMEWYDLADEDQFVAYLWLEWSQYYFYDAETTPYDTVEAAYQAYLIQAYSEDHPGEVEELDLDEMLAKLGYTKTLPPMEHFMEDYGISDKDAAIEQLKYLYVNRRLRVEETLALARTYREEYPDKWAEFDPDGYFEESNAGYYLSMEACMESADLRSREELNDFLFVEYVEANRWRWIMEEDGWSQGYSSGPSLVVNGKRYTGDGFTLEDGTSYLTADVLSTILGVELEAAGDEPVAIRPAAEAAGWDVVWNEYHSQVILLDREKLMTGYIIPDTWEFVPCDFSQYSELARRLYAAVPGEGESLRTESSARLTLTLLDSLDGDKTYHFGLEDRVLARDQVIDLDLTLDLADLKELLGETLLDQLLADLTKADRQTLKEELGAIQIRAILDQETGSFAWNFPLVSLVDPSIAPETWFTGGEYTGVSFQLYDGTLDLNERLYERLLESSATISGWFDGEYAYTSFLTTKSLFNLIYGNESFTQEGEDLVWDLAAGLTKAWESQYVPSYDQLPFALEDLFQEMTLRITVSPDGTAVGEYALRPDMEAIAQASASEWDSPMETAMTAFLLNMVDFRYTAQGQSKGGTGTEHVEFHLKNQFKLTVEVETKRQKCEDLPLTTPPEDAPIQTI